jgi:hypothetical protein
MASFESASMADVAQRTARRCKTDPLRDAVMGMSLGDCMFVPYYDEATEEGFKPNTITQVVGALSRVNSEVRYAVRRDTTRPGSFVLCLPRRTEEEIAENAERRERRKASAAARQAAIEAGEAPPKLGRKARAKAEPEAVAA